MAAFSVAFDGTRIQDASSQTGWTSTNSVETDFYYNGSACIVDQIKTARNDMYYTSGSTYDFTPATGTRQVWIAKTIQTNAGAIDGNGLELWIGSSSTDRVGFYEFTAATYPVEGGWQIVCIDPNGDYGPLTQQTTGTIDRTAIDTFYFASDASATAKAPNFGSAAIDIMDSGTGLTGTDGSTGDGTFADFSTADYGTSSGRWGVVAAKAGILYVSGVLTIGSSATATFFTDTNKTIVFPEHHVFTGFCGLDLDIQNASTDIAISSCVFNGRGQAYTSPAHDTRPDYEIIGTSGTASVTGCTFNGYRILTLGGETWTDNQFLNGGESITAAGADITGSTFSGFTGAADDSYLDWNTTTDTDGLADGVTFVKGTNAHHAIEFSQYAASYTLRDIVFSGFTNTIGNNATPLYFPDTGADRTWSITANGCTGLTANGYKKARAGDTVTITLDQVTLTIEARDTAGSLITASTDFTLVRDSDQTVLSFQEDQTDGTVTYVYTYSSDVPCYVNVVTSGAYIPVTAENVVLTGSDQTVTVTMPDDRVYDNP